MFPHSLMRSLSARRSSGHAGDRRRLPRRRAGTLRLTLGSLEDRSLPSFAAPAIYTTGASPQAVVTADFNGDPQLDLAVANYNDSTVSVLLGNTDGTFQPAVTAATGGGPLSVAVGDFNGDGMLDLATANTYDVSVMTGNGDGTFDPPASLGVAGNPQSVAVGDFNGDGTLDLGVTSNVFTPGYYGPGYWGSYGYYPGSYIPGYTTGYANVLVGNGDGSFSGPNTTFLDFASHSAALAVDLNGDASDDFVASHSFGYITVTLGDSSGNLQGPVGYFYTGDVSYGLAAADLDGDGDNDLVTANVYGNSVGVLLGDGLGGFGAAQSYATGVTPLSIVVGDFDLDTRLDVATANVGGNDVSVLRGRGNGTFSAPEHFAAGPAAYSIAAGDFNGDGWLDAATANYSGASASVLINDQSWPDPPPPAVSVGDATVTEGNTGTANAAFTVTLSHAADDDVTVHYDTADVSATAGTDYAATSGDVTIPAGQLSRTFTVPVIGDGLAEATETFAVNLSAPANATVGDGQGIGTILDNEPRASVNDVTVTEGNTGSVNATFTVTLSATSTLDVIVRYDTANGSAAGGSDYATTTGTVTVPAGQLSRTFTVPVTGDRVAESSETYQVNLTSPVNAGIADGQGVGTILDNEPRISINNVSKREGNGNTTKFVFTVTLSAPYDQAVTVNYATANGTATAGSDYQTKSGTVTFAPGVRTMTITILVVADKLKEANETFFVNLSGPSSNAFVSVPQGTGTILDDDNH